MDEHLSTDEIKRQCEASIARAQERRARERARHHRHNQIKVITAWSLIALTLVCMIVLIVMK
jgi:hypothetical protein